MLAALYFLNFGDRQIINIPGFVFAALYATLGVPIARLADRRHRVDLLAAVPGTDSLRWALTLILSVLARCAYHYVAATRTLRTNLEH